ncbi:MAG: restriction endonuclease subunit S, partial [Cetobacterium sp.]
LGEIGEIISGLTYSPNDVVEEGILVLRSSNVQDRTLKFEDNVYVNVKIYNPVKENDILICVRNGSKKLIGKNALITKESEGLAFGAFMSIFRSSINKFIFQYFDTPEYKENVYINLGATINSINGNDLKKFKINLPSFPEQEKIGNFLSSIDSKIQIVEKKLSLMKDYKNGLLQKMFV